MSSPLRVLIIDDSERDARLLLMALRKGGLEPESDRVDTAGAMEQAMAGGTWDVAICDCRMPDFTIEEALAIWQREGKDQPFIAVSGAIGEEEAVELLKAGAHDFIKKDNFSRLVPAVERELRDSAERRARKEAEKALRESEEKYRLLFSAESDAIVILDAQNHQVVEVNIAAAQLFRYGPEEFVGLAAQDLTSEPDEVQGYIDEILQGKILRISLFQHKKKDGTTFPAEISAGTFMWKDRQMAAVIIRDITERHKIEQMKDELLSAVSHEMRTPLTSMIGFIDFMLNNEVDAEQQREWLELVAKATIRLKDMIDNLLSFQRLRAGYENIHFQPVAIWPLLYEAVNLFGRVSNKHPMVIDCEADLPTVRGDSERLRQALSHLLSNAIKFSPAGGTVTLGARIEGGSAILWVKDEGQGIAPENLDEIFDRFFRLDPQKGRAGSTGLGLPLVKEIANAHGGQVWVESSLGKGSTFYLAIPLATAGQEA
jgi:hypothetical protein